ncbi:hypothetical protein J6590_053104 [Homalodisca vitripennis]|nr:hypothetical protein J6590_053104 [Homalodisca vitripennis]
MTLCLARNISHKQGFINHPHPWMGGTEAYLTIVVSSRVLRNSGLDTEQDEDCRDRKRVIISVYERFRVHMDIDERHEPSKRKKMFVVNSLTLSRDRCDRRSCRTLVSFRESRRCDVTLSCLL